MASIEPALLWVAGICAAIVTILGCIEKLTKPVKDLKTRVDKLEDLAATNSKKLINDHESLTAQEDINMMLLKSTSLLLKHNATGNHNGELAKQADEIDQYIYKKGGSIHG